MVTAIILMAGSSTRMKMNEMKCFLKLKDKMVFEYSLNTFYPLVDEIILVIRKEDEILIKPYLDEKIKYVFGGKERQDSVYNALKVSKGDYILIHDAARPLISKDVIKEILINKNNNEAILTYLPSKDSIRIKENNNLVNVKRDNVLCLTTPLCASLDILLDSYNKAINDNLVFTDDIAVIQNYHKDIKINLILSNEEDIKLTTRLDYYLLNAILENK